jgi:1-acyl-sn-glycerol-3-phosphate acyltransferase
MVRTYFTAVVLLLATIWNGGLVLLAQLFGVKPTPEGIYVQSPRRWARALLWAGGVKVERYGGDDLPPGTPRVFIANHVSWYDIPAMIEALPHYGFVAKRELETIPLFGAAAKGVGVIYIDRENRKAAFGAYEDAAKEIRAGRSVLVYPEGTRGDRYSLRPFKKGPFVLAIGSGAPIVPVVIHGTIEVNPRSEFRVTPGTVHVHMLEPIPTEGLTYADRDALAERVRERMGECLEQRYAITPPLEQRVPRPARSAPATELSPSP